MQKYANLVDLEKCCKMTIWWPKSASIQPRTSLGKSVCCVVLSTCQLGPRVERAAGGGRAACRGDAGGGRGRPQHGGLLDLAQRLLSGPARQPPAQFMTKFC